MDARDCVTISSAWILFVKEHTISIPTDDSL